jgi:hypothetical protein
MLGRQLFQPPTWTSQSSEIEEDEMQPPPHDHVEQKYTRCEIEFNSTIHTYPVFLIALHASYRLDEMCKQKREMHSYTAIELVWVQE